MPATVLVKVYGDLSPVPYSIVAELQAHFPMSEIMEPEEMLIHQQDFLRLAFEGIYFDMDDILPIIHTYLTPQSAGKIDYLDLDAWRMTRYVIKGTTISISSVGLNNVMDYAGL